MPMRNRVLICTLGVALATTSLLADTRIEYKTTEGAGDLSGFVIAQGKIRTDADKTTSVILDPGAGVMTVIDHSKKTFMKITKADIDAMIKQLEDMMASIPPEARQMMAGRMGGAGAGAAVAMTPTGESATVAGKSCKIYNTTVGGKLVAESCLGEPSAIDLSAADRATMQAAMAWAKELTDSLAKTPFGRIGDSMPFKTGGIPLRSTKIASNGARSTSEFTGVNNGAVAADTFTVPAGYKEEKLGMGGRGRGGN